jgi:hypothetical protein
MKWLSAIFTNSHLPEGLLLLKGYFFFYRSCNTIMDHRRLQQILSANYDSKRKIEGPPTGLCLCDSGDHFLGRIGVGGKISFSQRHYSLSTFATAHNSGGTQSFSMAVAGQASPFENFPGRYFLFSFAGNLRNGGC